MYYKLSVKRFIKNTENKPEGEESFTTIEDVQTPIQVTDGNTTRTEVKTERKEVVRNRPIIPTWILADTKTIYQEVNEQGTSHLNYYDEQGKPFSIDSHLFNYEVEVVETDVIPPFKN